MELVEELVCRGELDGLSDAIAVVICISTCATTLISWQFKALAKMSSVNQDSLAIFFGNFYFYAGVLALLFQLALTTRLLRRFGIGPMLFVLPIFVLAGSAALSSASGGP